MSAEAQHPFPPQEPVDEELLASLRGEGVITESPHAIERGSYSPDTPAALVRALEREAEQSGIRDLGRDARIEVSFMTRLAHTTVRKTFDEKKRAAEQQGHGTRWQGVSEDQVDKAIDAFFAEFPRSGWNDGPSRQRRHDYLRRHVAIAEARSNTFPEVTEAFQLLQGCNEKGLQRITPAVTLLLAAYGRRFEHLSRSTGSLVLPAGSGPMRPRPLQLPEDDVL